MGADATTSNDGVIAAISNFCLVTNDLVLRATADEVMISDCSIFGSVNLIVIAYNYVRCASNCVFQTN